MSNSRSRIAIAVAGVLTLAAQIAQAQEKPGTTLDEVTVTGTFIRRSEGFTPASPVAEISKAEFEANAPKTVADFFTTLPYSFNTTFTVGRALGSSNGSGSLNLRNLGADATLVLLNGRRVARDPVTVNNVDVNALLPQIAIERIEILKDGASSLYGSDAVGGVANFLTRSSFNGFEVVAQSDTREIGSTTDVRFSALWGAQSENTRIIVGAEYFNRAPYTWESYELISERAGSIDADFRLTGWPARYTIPNRNAAGAIAGAATTLADPLCSLFTAANTPGGSVTRLGITYPTTCVQNVPVGTSANADEKRYQVYAEVHHDFSEHVKLFGEFGYLRTRTALIDTPGAAVNPGPGQPNVIIPGYAPGNTFRALNTAGAPLFAQSSGVQLSYDKNGDGINEFIPLRNAAGVVTLNLGVDGIAGTPDDAVGGIPFWEDVTIAAGSRILGLNCNMSGDPASSHNCRTDINSTRYEVDTFRLSTGFEGELWGDWNYQTAYTYSSNKEDDTTLGSAFSMPALRAGLTGFGGSGCLTPSLDPLQSGTIRPGQGQCQFFNMFANSVTAPSGSNLTNTADMVMYVTAQDWIHYLAETNVFDFVVSGSLFDLPAGKLGLAVGVQQRKETWAADYPALQNQGQTDLQAPFFDKDVDQTANAIFAEISAPLIDNSIGKLELSGALRYEETKGEDLSTTDPKVGLLYSLPSGMFKARATWSTSFLAPSLYQRFRQNVVFTNGVDDGRTPAVNENLGRVPTQIVGNPNLDPQTSENYNFGVTVKPFESLSVDIDYWHFLFEGQIAVENGLALALDPITTEDPTKVVRNAAGTIVGLNLTYVNNASVETAGLDFAITHRWDMGSIGSLRNNIQATYQTDYNVNGVDVTGGRNGRVTGASFAIPWRATLRTDWALGSHSVQSLIRFVDGYSNDVPGNAGSTPKAFVESYIAWDLSYTFAFDWEKFKMKNSGVSVGMNNVLDTVPPWVPDSNHTLPSMYDYSGRHFWLRVRSQF
jgi:outer membrane receptor for ferrienterochelin and colicin